jgi:hemerythrin superfamily protein
LSEIYQQEEISQIFRNLSLSQEAEEGKVFPRLSEISQGAEAEEEISQIMSEISQEGGEGAEGRRSLSKIVRDISRRRSRSINLSNNVRHLSHKPEAEEEVSKSLSEIPREVEEA